MKTPLVWLTVQFATLLLMLSSPANAASISGSNNSNVSIPDGSPGAWVYSRIDISGAPAGATVTSIEVYFRCVHPYSGDLEIDLEVGSFSNSERLWDNDGGAADNPSDTITTSSFNGLPVNNSWYLYARDTSTLDAGNIDEWTIKIYYDSVTPTTYAITPDPGTVSEGAGELTFTITRSGGLPAETIYASTVNGTANGYSVNNGDYDTDVNNLAVNFSLGETTETVDVTILNDAAVESDETFGFVVQRNTSDPLTTYLDKANFTITDNDVLPTTYAVTPDPGTVSEGAGTLRFTITRSGGLPAETIYASTVNGTANGYSVNNSDYSTDVNNLAVTFSSGETTETVDVTILNDSSVESDETFGFIVQRNTSDPLTTYLDKANFTITDNDVLPTTYAVTPDPGTVSEGAGTLRFTITRSGGLPAETIYASTVNGTANGYSVNNSDYSTDVNNLAVTFSSGETTETVDVTILNDSSVESDETFGFVVQRSTSDPLTTYLDKVNFTITDNDEEPTTYAITPDPATVSEGAGTLRFTITRSGGLPAETIYASTVNGTANGYSVNSGDYGTDVNNLNLTFAAGETTETVDVTILNDAAVESDEIFGFIVQRNTSDPLTTYLDKINFTITDEDVQPPTGRPDPSSAPGIRFSLPLASDSPSHYYFDRNPAAGAVLAWNGVTTDDIPGGAFDGHRGTDFSGVVRNTPVYAAASGTLIEKDDGHPDGSLSETTFPNGNFVRINHGNDNTGTPIITVYLHLNEGTVTTKAVGSSINAGELIGGIGRSGQASGLHLHFETQRGTPPNRVPFDPYAAEGETSWWSEPAVTSYAITPDPATVTESAGTLTFTITRSGSLPSETIYASTVNGSANGYSVNNGDYGTSVNNLAVMFSSGEATKTVDVTILNDATVESDETFGFIVQRNTSDPLTSYLDKVNFTITDNDVSATQCDIVVQNAPTISPNPATPGSSISVAYTIHNNGPGNAAPSQTKIRIKNASGTLITEQTFSAPAINAAADSPSQASSIAVPAGTPAGTYRAHVILDNLSELNQSSSANDYTPGVTFVVQTSPSTKPDLAFQSRPSVSSPTVQSGNDTTVSFIIENKGTAAAVASKTKVWIKNNSGQVIDSQVIDTPALNLGESIPQQVSLTIPASTPAGICSAQVILDNVRPGLDQLDEVNDYSEKISISVTSSSATPPASGYVEGIDFNAASNDDLNWQAAATAGIKFAYLKASEREDFPSSTQILMNNVRSADEHGIRVGAYHFGTPLFSSGYHQSGDEAETTAVGEARHFYEVAKSIIGPGFLPPALDIEEQIVRFEAIGGGQFRAVEWADPLTGIRYDRRPDPDVRLSPDRLGMGAAALANWIRDWMKEVERLSGVKPILYCDRSYAAELDEYLGSSFNLWIADWTNPKGAPDKKAWDNWSIHQYQGLTPLAGTEVDLNVLNGTLEQMLTPAIQLGARGQLGFKPEGFCIELSGNNSEMIILQRSDNCVDWTDVNPVEFLNGVGQFIDGNANTTPQAFYRVKPPQ